MIAHKTFKVIVGIMLVVLLIFTSVMSTFASLSLDDADFECSVKAYYLKYSVLPTWTKGIALQPDGSTIEVESFRLTSDFVSVVPSGTVSVIDTSRFLPTNILSYCFYDSSHSLISGGNNVGRFLDVPANASYIRVTQSGSSSYYILSSPTHFDSFSDKFLWGEIENVTISDNIVTIPYQTYSFNFIRLYGFFYDDNMPYSSVGLSYKLTFTNTNLYSGLVTFYDSDSIAYASLESLSYIPYGEGDILHEYQDGHGAWASSKNPGSLYTTTEDGNFVGFLCTFPVNFQSGVVSTSINIELSNFILDDKSVEVEYNVNDTLSQLSDLAQQLALPTPDLNTLLDVGSVLDRQNDTNANSVMRLIASDGGIITTMMFISVSITVLGYILFGKKEA